MEQEVVKASPSLGRDARYTKRAAVTRLPAYLCVDFVRFYYKKKEQTNCQVLKDCKFPLTLDMFELCAPALQQALVPARSALKAWNDYAADRAASDKVPAASDGTDAAAAAAAAAAGPAVDAAAMDTTPDMLPVAFPGVRLFFFI